MTVLSPCPITAKCLDAAGTDEVDLGMLARAWQERATHRQRENDLVLQAALDKTRSAAALVKEH